MGLRLWTIVVDSSDPGKLGRWWAEALGWKIFYESEEELVITTEDQRFPGLVFVPVPEGKTVKNRLHLDLVPDDQDVEVERLLGMGAARTDVGQSDDEGWVVLADPEGNEFCVLSAREGGM
jgi:hypothetical protein